MRGLILVYAPSAIDHRGQQFGFLLIGSGQILARKLILRLLLEVLAAFSNKLVELAQVLLQRGVHRSGTAGLDRPHVGDVALLLVERRGGAAKRIALGR